MKLYWEKCSIQRNTVLIGMFIFWLTCAIYCKNTATTKRGRTLLEDNPVYVQNFVSRMMSKYPQLSNHTLRDYTGFELGPNLGYEPYWKNLPDMTLESKCARCPELFKRYKMVCAVDSWGEVTVNISMCDLLRQNCLAGTAYGRSTGKRYDFQGQYFVVANGWARVSFRQNLDAIIQLSTTPDTTGNRYVIQIDAWSGRWSVIYKNERSMQWYRSGGYKTLWDGHWVEFVMRWNASSGWFLITKPWYSNWTHAFNLNVTDPDPFPIKYIAVSGSHGNAGDWIIKDLPTGFMVSQLAPCAEGSVAQPLVTSPTEASNILKRHSPINKGYYSRIHAEGINVVFNVSFDTREEY